MTADDETKLVKSSDLFSAFNRLACSRIDSICYETAGDRQKVQWAAHKAIAALERLELEMTIAEERRRMAQARRSINGHRTMLRLLLERRIRK